MSTSQLIIMFICLIGYFAYEVYVLVSMETAKQVARIGAFTMLSLAVGVFLGMCLVMEA